MTEEYNCLHCGKRFKPRSYYQKYCSRKCATAHRYQVKKENQVRIMTEEKNERIECKGCDYDFYEDCNEGCQKVIAMDELETKEEENNDQREE
nr:MAG: Zn finger protein [uncultured archaeon]